MCTATGVCLTVAATGNTRSGNSKIIIIIITIIKVAFLTLHRRVIYVAYI